jgi:hypothetical protein
MAVAEATLEVPIGTAPGEVLAGSVLPAHELPGPALVVLVEATAPQFSGSCEPAEVVPGEAVPGEAVPGEVVPGEVVPVAAVLGEAVPVEAVPAEAVPAEAVPADVGASCPASRGGPSFVAPVGVTEVPSGPSELVRSATVGTAGASAVASAPPSAVEAGRTPVAVPASGFADVAEVPPTAVVAVPVNEAEADGVGAASPAERSSSSPRPGFVMSP